MDATRQPFKAPRNLEAISGGAAAEGITLAQQNGVGSNAAAIATAAFPNPVSLTLGVCAAHVTITPKVTGKFRVRAVFTTETNATGAAGTVLAGIGHVGPATPVDGVTVLTDDGSTAATPAGVRTTAATDAVAINGCATEELVYLYGQAGSPCNVPAFPIGVQVSFALVLSQSGAAITGAVNGLAAGNAFVEVQELP